MSMVHTKESLIVDVEDSLRVSLRNRNGRHSMCLCRRKECWKRWILASQLQTYVTPRKQTKWLLRERKIYSDGKRTRICPVEWLGQSCHPHLTSEIHPLSWHRYPRHMGPIRRHLWPPRPKERMHRPPFNAITSSAGYLPIPFLLQCHGGRPLQHRQKNNLSGKTTLKTPDMSSSQPLIVCIELTPSAS